MKSLILLVFLALIVIYSKGQSGIKKHSGGVSQKAHTQTLDSLQGTWTSIDDHKNHMKIKGRSCEMYYDGMREKEFYRLYFSDTLVDCVNMNFKDLKIDTNALSGIFLLAKNTEADSQEFWSWELYGFYHTTKLQRTVSMVDTWAQRKPSVFKRVSIK